MFLREATAGQVIFLGRFVDKTDGDTEETGLTVLNTDIKLLKHGATSLVSKNSGHATHMANSLFYATLDATDTNTVGRLEVHVHVSGSLAIKREYFVACANWFDAVLGTDKLKVDVVEINSSQVAAIRQALAAGVIVPATVDNTGFTPTTTELEADDITEATADHFNGRTLTFTSGALLQQSTIITDYSLASGRGHFTVSILTEAPANDDTFIIV